MKTITISQDIRKRTTPTAVTFYDRLDIDDSRVTGYINGRAAKTWYFKDYQGVDLIRANLNSQFAQVVFLNGGNSKNRANGIDLLGMQNRRAMNDPDRILFCSGMFSYQGANNMAERLAAEIGEALDTFRNHQYDSPKGSDSLPIITQKEKKDSSSLIAEKIRQYKELFDSGLITETEFTEKKKQILGL